jgi:hypothetical protein
VFRPAVAEALGAQVEAGDFEGHPFRGNQYEKMVIGRIINGEDVESKDVTAAAEEGDLAATEHPPQWQSESAKRWKVVGDDKVVWTQRPTQIEKEMTEDHLERKHGIKVGRHTVWTEVGA